MTKESSILNLEAFNDTPVVKKIRSKRAPKASTPKEPAQPKEPMKRGRKIKYTTAEERIDARRKQQREYRARKKDELVELRRIVAAAAQATAQPPQ